MKLQKVAVLALGILAFNSHAMEKPCTSIDDLRKDKTSFYSWLPAELQKELGKFMSDSAALKWALHKHAESVGFNAKRLKGHTGSIKCLAMDKINNRLISGSLGATIKIWNPKTEHCEKTLEGHTDWITCLVVAGNRIISGSHDRTIKIWNPETGHCEKTLQGHTGSIRCILVLNNRIISGSYDNSIKIWNPETGQCEKTLQGHTGSIKCLAMDKINNRLISGSSEDGAIKIWNIETGHCEKTLQGHTDSIFCLAVANSKIISGSGYKTIKIWNPEKELCEKTLEGHASAISCLIVANNRIISGSYDNTIKIWDLETGHCCYSLEVPGGFIGHIDAAAGYAYIANGSDIIILKLEDPTIKEALESSMDATNLMESVYECSQKNKALDLRTNAWLHTAFMRLPSALREIIQEQVTVRLPWSWSSVFAIGLRRA